MAAVSTVGQGLFFQQDTLITAAVITAGGLVWLWLAGDGLSLEWADLTIAAYVALAVLSFFWAANRQNAVAEGALWVSAAMVYIGLRRIREREGFLDGVLLGGILLILFGVLENLHVLNIYQWSLAGRLTFGLQYPDAAGALAFALGFLALWRSRLADERWSSALIGAGAAFWMDAFLTVSRGALLVVPVAALVGLIITPRGDRGPYLRLGATALVGATVGAGLSLKVNPITGLATAVVIAGGIDWLLGRASWDPKKALVLAGGFLVLLGVFVAERSHHPIPLSATSFPVIESPHTPSVDLTISGPGTITVSDVAENAFGVPTTVRTRAFTLVTAPRKVGFPLTGLPVGTRAQEVSITLTKGRAFLDSATPASPVLTLARVLPASIYGRFATLGPTDLSVWQRLLFIRDSLRLWAERPFLGWGGGGWGSAYRSIETFSYTSLETHSSLTDALTSYGALGGALFLAFFGLALLGAYRAGRGDPKIGLALAAVLSLLLHSFIDFDFSFPTLVLLTVGLLASLQPTKLRVARTSPRWIPSLALLALLAATFTAAMGSVRTSAGQAAQVNGNTTQAHKDFVSALRYGSYDATAWLGAATTQTDPAVAVADVRQAVAQAPEDTTILASAAQVALQAGDVTLAEALGKRAMMLGPKYGSAVTVYGQAYLQLAVNDINTRKDALARIALRQAARAMGAYDARLAAADRLYPASVVVGPPPAYDLIEGQVAALLGNTKLALADLSSPTVTDTANGPEAAAWLYALGTLGLKVPNMSQLQTEWSSTKSITSQQISAIAIAVATMNPHLTPAASGAGG